jgi:UbiD family decarboxylase
MAWYDIREFLSAMEKEGHVLHIRDELDPDQEIGAVWTRLTRAQGPIGLHERGSIRGFPDWRIASNVFGSNYRIARAFGISEDSLSNEVEKRLKQPIEPVVVDDGPINQNEYVGDEIDLTKQIPNIRWNKKDAGSYITFGNNVLTDPRYGINVACYRGLILGPRRVAINYEPIHHGDIYLSRARNEGQSEYDVAIYIGGPPSAIAGAVAEVALAESEYDAMGGLQQEPLQLVKCKTVDRLVPATAEVVLEGKVKLNEEVLEGPFGEFTGLYTEQYTQYPIEITRLAFRDNPIWIGTAECRPVNETHLLLSLFESICMKQKLSGLIPEIKDIYFPPESCGVFECIVQLDSSLKRPGISKNILYSLSAGFLMATTFILVDDDIDIRNRDEVSWALATRVRNHKDIIIVPEGITTPLNPAATPKGVVSKKFIDATREADARGDFISIPKELKELADKVIQNSGGLNSE